MHPGDSAPDFFILYPVTGLPVILHDLPGPAATLRVYLINNHVPVLVYPIRVSFTILPVFSFPIKLQQNREIAVYGGFTEFLLFLS
jgi:hypothetical protein